MFVDGSYLVGKHGYGVCKSGGPDHRKRRPCCGNFPAHGGEGGDAGEV